MKKILLRLLSLAIMLSVPLFVIFPGNEWIARVYIGNEFIHWLQIPFILLALFALNSDKYKEENPKDTAERIEALLEKSIIRTLILWVDIASLFLLVLILNDFSFATALAISLILDNSLKLAAKENNPNKDEEETK